MSEQRPRVRLHDVHVTGEIGDEAAQRAAIERAVTVAAGRGRLDAESLRSQISAHLAGQGLDGVAEQGHADHEVPRRGTP